MVLKIINFSWETLLKCCKNWLAISSALESNTTHFRNTGTNKGKEYSTIQMVLYGCKELKRAHLNWVDPILAWHTFAHGIVCISYLFISFHIFSYLFISFDKWQEYIATIPPIQCRSREIDTDNFNIIESMDDVMFCRAELHFTIKLKCRNGEVFEIPLVCFSAFERVQQESDNEMHKMTMSSFNCMSLAPSLCMSLSFV